MKTVITVVAAAAVVVGSFSALSGSSAQADAAPSFCRVKLADTLNGFKVVLDARAIAPKKGEAEAYEVTDKFGTPQAYPVQIAFAQDSGQIVSGLGVPYQSRQDVLSAYSAMTSKIHSFAPTRQSDNGSITWTLQPGSSCSDAELSLIQFLVMEWFYYG